MDLLITAAARALAGGKPLDALNHVALRNDAPALALRGIAMAQLGDLVRAKSLVRSAARAFGPKDVVARAKCIVAEAEMALASRELGWPAERLSAARATLLAHGNHVNAAHAQYLQARRQLLIGHLDEAEHTLANPACPDLPPALNAARELVLCGIALRRLQSGVATRALARAADAARRAGIPALQAEVETLTLVLNAPAACLITRDKQRPLLLDQVETLLASNSLIVDACRYTVRQAQVVIPLARRPVLFTLARMLGEAWPADVPRSTLIMRAFRMKTIDESHRARLRVEMGRLRALLRPLAEVRATRHGYVLTPHRPCDVAILARLAEDRYAAVLALLADGESWSSSALALALGASQRTVQRALDALAASGKAQSFGYGRARRWIMPPVPGFATTLLLPAALPGELA